MQLAYEGWVMSFTFWTAVESVLQNVPLFMAFRESLIGEPYSKCAVKPGVAGIAKASLADVAQVSRRPAVCLGRQPQQFDWCLTHLAHACCLTAGLYAALVLVTVLFTGFLLLAFQRIAAKRRPATLNESANKPAFGDVRVMGRRQQGGWSSGLLV
jgi:hypothetical protein